MKTAWVTLLLIAGLGTAAAQEPEGPVRVSKQVLAARSIDKARPAYPQEAKDARAQGKVVLEVLVDKEGRVSRVTVLSGPELLRDSAATAVRQWTYRPMLLNGEPVEVISLVDVNYDLR